MKAYTTLDFRQDVLPPNDQVPEFVGLEQDIIDHLRKRMGSTRQPIAMGGMSIDDYPPSTEWAY